MRRKKSFTLAEVLIVLGIIGVIAAITIPSLMSNTSKNVYYSQFQEGNAIITNAAMQVYQDHNFNIADEFAEAKDVINELATKLKYQKICDSTNYDGVCWHSDNSGLGSPEVAMNLTKTRPIFDVNHVYDGILLNNGMLIGISDNFFDSTCSSAWSWDDATGERTYCADIFIDVNGIKEPNIMGRDIFGYNLGKYKFDPDGLDNQDISLSDGYCDTIADPASAPENGKACTYKLILDHAMNY